MHPADVLPKKKAKQDRRVHCSQQNLASSNFVTLNFVGLCVAVNFSRICKFSLYVHLASVGMLVELAPVADMSCSCTSYGRGWWLYQPVCGCELLLLLFYISYADLPAMLQVNLASSVVMMKLLGKCFGSENFVFSCCCCCYCSELWTAFQGKPIALLQGFSKRFVGFNCSKSFLMNGCCSNHSAAVNCIAFTWSHVMVSWAK